MKGENIVLKTLKLRLLGDSGVGKTSICKFFLGMEFTDEMASTYFTDRYETKLKLKNGEEKKIYIFDTPGKERFRNELDLTLRHDNAHVLILVFDVTKKESFINLNIWLERIDDYYSKPFIVLFGNKADIDKDKWEVASEQPKNMAKEKGFAYFEVSAKTGKGIKEGISYALNEKYKKIIEKDNDGKRIMRYKPPNHHCFKNLNG